MHGMRWSCSACLAIAVAAFAALVVVGIPAVNTAALMHTNWQAAIGPLPIMIVAFTFHNMIPSLMTYLGSAKLLFKAVFFGSLIPLVSADVL
jgi:tyrosine-specific transport protein